MEPNFQGPLVADPPSVFGYISGAYGPSTARYGRGGSPPRGLRKKLTLLPQLEDRTGFARAPEEEEPPALELPEGEPLAFRVATPHGAPTRKTNSGDPKGETIADGLPVGA